MIKSMVHSKCSINVGYYQYVQCILLIVEICKVHFSKSAVIAEKEIWYTRLFWTVGISGGLSFSMLYISAVSEFYTVLSSS